MERKVNKEWFEKVQLYKGYKPYHKSDRIDFVSQKHWIIWAFRELPGEYHELVSSKGKSLK